MWTPFALALLFSAQAWCAEPVYVPPDLQSHKLIHREKPAYPMTAKAHRITGLVTLRVLIGTDGQVRTVQVVSGHPLLLSSAISAVRHWRYRETLLGPDPVEVVTTVEIWVGPASMRTPQPPRGVESIVYRP